MGNFKDYAPSGNLFKRVVKRVWNFCNQTPVTTSGLVILSIAVAGVLYSQAGILSPPKASNQKPEQASAEIITPEPAAKTKQKPVAKEPLVTPPEQQPNVRGQQAPAPAPQQNKACENRSDKATDAALKAENELHSKNMSKLWVRLFRKAEEIERHNLAVEEIMARQSQNSSCK